MSPAEALQIWLIEDNSSRTVRRTSPGVRQVNGDEIIIRLHSVRDGRLQALEEFSYKPGSLLRRSAGRAQLALDLIARARIRSGVVVAGSAYGNSPFIEGLLDLGLDFALEIPRSIKVEPRAGSERSFPQNQRSDAKVWLERAAWTNVDAHPPQLVGARVYTAAELGLVKIGKAGNLRLFAIASGGITDLKRGVVLAVTSLMQQTIDQLADLVGWTRWNRAIIRRAEREVSATLAPSGRIRDDSERHSEGLSLLEPTSRPNIRISLKKDEEAAYHRILPIENKPFRHMLRSTRPILNVVELFAGAGGMGLGFLLARSQNRRYRIIFSGEANPIYAQTLQANHEYFNQELISGEHAACQEEAFTIDLNSTKAVRQVAATVREAGGVDVVIGGPPCQGFSSANRNSWSSDNPHNELIDTFIDYVKKLVPPVVILENVQGILWTSANGNADGLSVATHVSHRLARAGYIVFPKLLDAVWYGVPQFRSRFFLVGIHKDMGYTKDDFGDWGPFPHQTHGPGTGMSYTTVREAIGDLPVIGNGASDDRIQYDEPSAETLRSNDFLRRMRDVSPMNVIHDHVTSRHSDYVLQRYKLIPPGGNWQDIIHTMTNYADVGRTHSNIYRRLKWNQPAITIGHYRKSMLVHPSQHRGLSLREASRLQSFPDWFRFAGSPQNGAGGLMHKQQQLANAVCPLVTKAVAEFILGL